MYVNSPSPSQNSVGITPFYREGSRARQAVAWPSPGAGEWQSWALAQAKPCPAMTGCEGQCVSCGLRRPFPPSCEQRVFLLTTALFSTPAGGSYTYKRQGGGRVWEQSGFTPLLPVGTSRRAHGPPGPESYPHAACAVGSTAQKVDQSASHYIDQLPARPLAPF